MNQFLMIYFGIGGLLAVTLFFYLLKNYDVIPLHWMLIYSAIVMLFWPVLIIDAIFNHELRK